MTTAMARIGEHNPKVIKTQKSCEMDPKTRIGLNNIAGEAISPVSDVDEEEISRFREW